MEREVPAHRHIFESLIDLVVEKGGTTWTHDRMDIWERLSSLLFSTKNDREHMFRVNEAFQKDRNLQSVRKVEIDRSYFVRCYALQWGLKHKKNPSTTPAP